MSAVRVRHRPPSHHRPFKAQSRGLVATPRRAPSHQRVGAPPAGPDVCRGRFGLVIGYWRSCRRRSAMQANAVSVNEVPVWDPLVRIVHWLATIVLVDWYTDKPRWMHVWLGYGATALVVLRIIWGF